METVGRSKRDRERGREEERKRGRGRERREGERGKGREMERQGEGGRKREERGREREIERVREEGRMRQKRRERKREGRKVERRERKRTEREERENCVGNLPLQRCRQGEGPYILNRAGVWLARCPALVTMQPALGTRGSLCDTGTCRKHWCSAVLPVGSFVGPGLGARV